MPLVPSLPCSVVHDMTQIQWEDKHGSSSTTGQPPLLPCHSLQTRTFYKNKPGGSLKHFFYEGTIHELQNSPKSIKKLVHAQKYKINYSKRSIQNGVIECNKLLSHNITGKPPKISGHDANPHLKISDRPPGI